MCGLWTGGMYDEVSKVGTHPDEVILIDTGAGHWGYLANWKMDRGEGARKRGNPDVW